MTPVNVTELDLFVGLIRVNISMTFIVIIKDQILDNPIHMVYNHTRGAKPRTIAFKNHQNLVKNDVKDPYT